MAGNAKIMRLSPGAVSLARHKCIVCKEDAVPSNARIDMIRVGKKYKKGVIHLNCK